MDSRILRSSPAKAPNPGIKDRTQGADERSNLPWLRKRPAELKSAVLLVGGTSLAHFRTRCAQAVMRRDLLPSFWSQVGILKEDDKVITVPVDTLIDISRVPDANGVEITPLGAFASAREYPNIALLRFTETMDNVIACAAQISPHREQLSLPNLIVRWLTYIWALGNDSNPLAEGIGVPNARWLESVFAASDLELTPGLSSGASCPEAIWQAALWWHEFYAAAAPDNAQGRRNAVRPSGEYIVRQPAAAPRGPRDADDGSAAKKSSKEFNPIVRTGK
ncbi:MAG TPA: hypothetical protein VH814_12405 [Steroidobacteraceae bacterium]|jgi:hypothetical protein